MQINFTKLQEAFLQKIKKEENLILKWQDISFEIQPNCESEPHRLKVYLKVFREEFSVGYPRENTTIPELIQDFYSRLHDYNTDDAKWHIVGLKIQSLEERFAIPIQQIKIQIIRLGIEPQDIWVDISDIAPSEEDERGFPPFGLFVTVKGVTILVREIGFDEFDYRLGEKLAGEVEEKVRKEFLIK